jgi:hypothetical protein
VEARIILTGRNVVEYDRERICAQIQKDLDQHSGLQSKGLRVLSVDIRDDGMPLHLVTQGNVSAYCMKCRATVDVKSPRSIVMKNGRPATQGSCGACGTKVVRIGTVV